MGLRPVARKSRAQPPRLEFLPSGPFVDYLLPRFGTLVRAADQMDVGHRRLARWMASGRVGLDFADRACVHHGLHLAEVWPLEALMLPSDPDD